MKANVGQWDRTIRVAAAFAIVVLLATHRLQGLVAAVAAGVALILVVTSLVGYCPAYSMIGANTCRKR